MLDLVTLERDPRLERWLEDPQPVHCVRYGTRSELFESAFVYWIERSSDDDTEAFVRLWARFLTDVEEGAPPDRAQLLRSIATSLVCERVTETEWNDECVSTRSIVEQIRAEILRQPELAKGPRVAADSRTYWGIFADEARMDAATFRFALPGAFEEVIALRRQWNERVIFARTSSAYGLFHWSTSA